jgi:hypothetical protein
VTLGYASPKGAEFIASTLLCPGCWGAICQVARAFDEPAHIDGEVSP